MKIQKIIIGLEVHVEPKTASKMFCSCSADHFGKPPNTQTCPICLGLPGTLPMPNKKAIELTVLLGLGLGGEIQKHSRFDRKNYFYPDLPKGYQISQYDEPFVKGGKIVFDSGKTIFLRRVHLEEDTGKLLHLVIDRERCTLIDFNRSGVPLIEIVSEPDLSSSNEAKEYLEKLQQIIRYLDVSEADMEKGSMRLEPNVNLVIEDKGRTFYTPIAEIKNINSFRFAKKAIEYEIQRQFKTFVETKAQGEKETRGWDEEKQITVPQRIKEEASDYRYFPEPDIPPFLLTKKEISNFKFQISNFELPRVKKERIIKDYGLTEYQANILTQEKEMAEFFEEVVRLGKAKNVLPSEAANVIINKRAREKFSPQELTDFIAASKEKAEISQEKLAAVIERLLAENPEVVQSYKKGKEQALGVIVGIIRKETGVIVPVSEIAKKIKD